MGVALPLAFLEAAAPGYLTDADWDALGEDWLEQALGYTAAPANGIRGPLSRIRPRTTGSPPPRLPARPTGWRTTSSSTAAAPAGLTFPRPTSGGRQPASPLRATCRP